MMSASKLAGAVARTTARTTVAAPLMVPFMASFRRFSDSTLRRTPLYNLHIENGASTTGFGGWDMPLYYKDGIMKEHVQCRTSAGLFDVSHMVPVRITGADRVAFAERVMVADVANLPSMMGCLTSIPNENGGLIDDCIITNAGDHLYLVINAGHEDKDLPHMQKYAAEFGDVQIEPLTGRGLLALQGPKAAAVLGSMTDVDLTQMAFMSAKSMKVNGVDCFVTRSGYTGEDGFEIMCAGADADGLARALLAKEEVFPIGLGARDSLRLEAGLCLYGNDIDDDTSPVEGVLLWTISKKRRADANFVGADKILAQIADKKLVTRKRVGFVNKGPPARTGDVIYTKEGEQVGNITSGVFGPTVKHPVSMGYVQKQYAKKGTELQVDIRGTRRPLVVTPMPFTPANFYRGP